MGIEASDFILQLAEKTQILACLKWLSDFQILACLPLNESMSFAKMADLAGISAAELTRVVRMTSTAGILCEPRPGYMAHTPLSSQFVAKPSLQDAIGFLAEVSIPAAMGMAETSRDPSRGFTLAAQCEGDSRLQRQMAALDRLVTNNAAQSVTAALGAFDWRALGKNAKVVETNAQTAAAAVAIRQRHPDLRIALQMGDERLQNSAMRAQSGAKMANIDLQYRALASPQTNTDAAVYIVHIPAYSWSKPATSLAPQIVAELRAHFTILRANPNAILILMARLLPEPGMLDPDVEAYTRMHDLWQLQTGNAHAIELSQFVELVDGIGDSQSRLVITRKLSSERHVTMAFEARIRAR